MNKKTIRIIAFATCIILLVLSFSSCNGNTGSGNVPSVIDPSTPAGSDATANRNEILAPLDNDLRSREMSEYKNINGKTVTLHNFYTDVNESGNNPNFPQAVLINQCIRYKDAHPDEDVYLTITSFHFSVYAAACIDHTKTDYGKMKNLYDEEYNSDGYWRLSYLLVEAAKKGIEVTVIGQIDASAVKIDANNYRADGDFEKYFISHLSDDAYEEGKKVSDFMTFRKAKWRSYGDKQASDMMHNKTLSVSNHIDNAGNEHGAAIWTGSINIDGIAYNGVNGNTGVQSAVVVTEHEEMRRVIYNYTRLMAEYCEQEEIVTFRKLIKDMNTEQIALISQGRAKEIPSDEQIIYLGTENDSVFELYFTPFGGTQNSWDTVNNPYCKYISKLSPDVSGDGYIELIWNNVKFVESFDLAETVSSYISNAFQENARTDNVLVMTLPGIDKSKFDSFLSGFNIGVFFLGEGRHFHIKDLQLSYEENGVRYYVTLYNSLNFHEGSMAYQTNTLLVVKETAQTGNDNYVDYATMCNPSIDFECRRVKKETE